ncbi:MAG: tRNA dihydrouridine synthase DusB [Desulfobacteraceae bacterium]|nr:tRNA dihydrouridine synthase DusB [Desulfobacteraceae bacterium]
MNIGTVTTDNHLVFAPLAGISNLPLRLLAKEAGCGLVCSEMISANGLVYGSDKTRQLLNSTAEEKPLSVQIFGSDPQMMADAARIVAASGADIIDINFGCSVKKVIKTGAGAALMNTPDLARRVITAVRQAVHLPLTIKIRTGWDAGGEQAVRIAGIAEAGGVDALAVHPRTAMQGFRGDADWDLIRRIKKQVSIPVIGNGDIVRAEDAVRMRDLTGCDGVMVGRAAIGNPYVFGQILALEAGRPVPEQTLQERRRLMRRYLNASSVYLGEKTACYMMRSRLCWFVKGLRNAGRFRESIRLVSSEAEAGALIDSYFDHLLDEAESSGYHDTA